LAKICKTFGQKKSAKEWHWKTLRNFGQSATLRQDKDGDEIWDEEQVQAFMKNVAKAIREFEKDF
jgi:cytochrome c2